MRKKLKLDLEELAVETFATTRPQTGRGTIQGYSGECGSSGVIFCNCNDTPGDPTYVNFSCATGEQVVCGCGQLTRETVPTCG